MTNRTLIANLVRTVVQLGKLPFSAEVDDVDKDHKLISKMLLRTEDKYDVQISKDKDKSRLWFSKRK